MLLTFYLLFIGLHVSEGCTLVNREKLLSITAHTGGSVLLACYCTDLHTTPEEFSWKKDNAYTQTREEISSESGQYRNRVQLGNGHSPGNLSLLISHLTKEDGGDYECSVKGAHLVIRLTVKEGPPKTTTSAARVSVPTNPTTSTTHLSQASNRLGGVIYWRYRGQSRGQTESQELGKMKTEHKTQDEVMYSTIVHSNTTATTTVSDVEEKAEYAIIRLNQ
ncbi:uncharacterized protein LOC118801014 [Colossoma macropomum]|uniref:uncharacterized protein LOC118801014 n=1 Tax=Colossoma macropomum TaxID=42526 RepID=UPI001864BBBF|nr:uncharacterized protein LOC118801014 [Colossoma macropomum]